MPSDSVLIRYCISTKHFLQSAHSQYNIMQALGTTYVRALINALSQFCLLIIEIISGAALPSSFRRPTWWAARIPYAASVVASASFFCTSWYLAIGLFLNCFLSSAYSRVLAMQSSRAPMVPQAIPYLAELRQLKGPFNPSTSGNMFASDTGHSSS